MHIVRYSKQIEFSDPHPYGYQRVKAFVSSVVESLIPTGRQIARVVPLINPQIPSTPPFRAIALEYSMVYRIASAHPSKPSTERETQQPY